MLELFKKHVKELLALQEQYETLSSSMMYEASYESEGVSVNGKELSSLLLEAMKDSDFLDSEKAILSKASDLLMNQSDVVGKDRLQKTEAMEKLKQEIIDKEVDIELQYSSLSKIEKVDLTYTSLRKTHFTDEQVNKLISCLDKFKIKYITFGGKICLIVSSSYFEFLSHLDKEDSVLFKFYSSYAQPVKFKGQDFDRRLIPLLKELIK